MRIDCQQVIAGHSALAIRQFMRAFDGETDFRNAQLLLGLSRARVVKILTVLRDEGFLEETLEKKEKRYQKTIKGNALMMASTRQQISRERATQLLQDFLGRCNEVVLDSNHLYFPSKAILFGSLATTAPVVNDIDIVLELSQKINDRTQHTAACKAVSDEAERNGKRFKHLLEKIF